MVIKNILFLLISLLLGACSTLGKRSKVELKEELREINGKYAKFRSLGSYVKNSVAIYGCSFQPVVNGGISNLKVQKLYDSLDGKYDKTVVSEARKLSGTIFIPERGENQSIYGKVYCFQNEKWPGADMHIPCSFVIYDNRLHQGRMSCSRQEFLMWVKEMHD